LLDYTANGAKKGSATKIESGNWHIQCQEIKKARPPAMTGAPLHREAGESRSAAIGCQGDSNTSRLGCR
jgi:hypothetical protein